MVCKSARLVAAFVVILLANLTKQHYIPPPDFCAFAKVCNHTGISLCGVEKKKENGRLFLDECDLYEFNCDNHKDYTETNIEKCTSNATVTRSTKPSTIITTLSSSTEANDTIANASKTVNTTETSVKTTAETVSTTNSSSNVTCVCPTVICRNITTSTTSSSDNATTSIINTTVSSINTTPFINSTEETNSPNTKVKNILTNTSIEAIANDTITEATTELTTTHVTISATEATASSSTNYTAATFNVTCTSNPTSTTTDEIILSVPISESASKTTPKTNFEKNTTSNEEIKTSQNKCDYPKHCNRPRTWETTAKGETRDFYQILRAQFGDRVKVLRDTTHFPRRIAKDYSNDDGFHFGYHNEKMNEIQ